MNAGEELIRLLRDSAAELGRELQMDEERVRIYTAERIAHLATVVGEPGYDIALRAERDSVALVAGINVVSAADAADQRLIGVIAGILGLGARVAAGA